MRESEGEGEGERGGRSDQGSRSYDGEEEPRAAAWWSPIPSEFLNIPSFSEGLCGASADTSAPQ